MNLNLRIKKVIFTGISFLTFFGLLNAQSKSTLKLGTTLMPGLGSVFLAGSDSASKAFVSAQKSNINFKFNNSANIWLRYLVKRKLDIMFGLGYASQGFTRKQENLNLYDKTYPGIGTGRIEDLSSSNKSINYNYTFNYLQIPVLLNWNVVASADYKIQFAYTAGANLEVLLKHKIVAHTSSGFAIDGEKRFVLDSTGFTANPIHLSLLGGCRVEFYVNKKIDLLVQPLISFSPLSLTQKPFSAIPYNFFLNLGFTYTLNE